MDGIRLTIAIDDSGKPRTKILTGKIWDGEPAKGMCDKNGKGVSGLKNYLKLHKSIKEYAFGNDHIKILKNKTYRQKKKKN